MSRVASVEYAFMHKLEEILKINYPSTTSGNFLNNKLNLKKIEERE